MSTPLKIIAKIHKHFDRDFEKNLPRITHTQKSIDGTIKLLLAYSDGVHIESAIIPFHRRHTVCLSTQAGCAMGCRFCQTGAQGLTRNLTAIEILSQYMISYNYLHRAKPDSTIAKPNIVFMGEGEPLHNFDQVNQACRMLLSKKGVCLGPRQITLSTVGYVPGLERLAELPCINLALSLHSAIPEKRQELIPLESTWNLKSILPLLEKAPLMKNQYINFEYLLIQDFNDSDEDAEELSALVKRFQAIVNIIPCNEVSGTPWKRPGEDRITAFKEMLVRRGVRTMVRKSKGADIQAACGQLKGSFSAGKQSP